MPCVATIAALALLVGLGLSVVEAWPRQDLSQRWEAQEVAQEQLDPLPPRSVLITELFSSGFNIWADQIVEGARPDVEHFHFPFVGYPGYALQVNRAHQDL